MSSSDFTAFIQVEVEEKSRLADVYQGVQVDGNPPAEHLTTEHLEKLLAINLPRDLRALYFQEYDEIRAALRAVAVCGLSRKDFYDVAAQESLRERDYLMSTLAYNTSIAGTYLASSPAAVVEQVAALAEVYSARKAQVVDRLKDQAGTLSNAVFTDADAVRLAMKSVDGANAKGISTEIKRSR